MGITPGVAAGKNCSTTRSTASGVPRNAVSFCPLGRQCPGLLQLAGLPCANVERPIGALKDIDSRVAGVSNRRLLGRSICRLLVGRSPVSAEDVVGVVLSIEFRKLGIERDRLRLGVALMDLQLDGEESRVDRNELDFHACRADRAALTRLPSVKGPLIGFAFRVEHDAAVFAQRSVGLRLLEGGRFFRAGGHPEDDLLATGQRAMRAHAVTIADAMRAGRRFDAQIDGRAVSILRPPCPSAKRASLATGAGGWAATSSCYRSRSFQDALRLRRKARRDHARRDSTETTTTGDSSPN